MFPGPVLAYERESALEWHCQTATSPRILQADAPFAQRKLPQYGATRPENTDQRGNSASDSYVHFAQTAARTLGESQVEHPGCPPEVARIRARPDARAIR